MEHGQLTGLDAAPAADRLAFGRGDGHVFLVQVTSGAIVAVLPEHTGRVSGVVFAGAELWTAALDGRVGVWRADTGERAHDFDARQGRLLGLVRVEPGLVATAGEDGSVCFWDAARRVLRHRVEGSQAGAVSVVVELPGGLAIGYRDGRVGLGLLREAGWTRDRDVEPRGRGVVRALAASPAAGLLAGARSGGITLLRLEDGAEAGFLLIDAPVFCDALGFSPRGSTLAAGCSDGRVRLWRRNGEAWEFRAECRPTGLGPLTDEPGAACSAVWMANEDQFVSTHSDGAIRATRVVSPDFQIGAVARYEATGVVAFEDRIGGPNPGMWAYLFPGPGAAEESRLRAEAAMRLMLAAYAPGPVDAGDSVDSGTPVDPPRDPRIDRLYDPDPEVRYAAAVELGERGDARALEPLEQVALDDGGSFSVEGAFVDGYEYVFAAALDALRSLYARLPLRAEDTARLTERILRPGADGERTEWLFKALGPRALPILEAVAHHEKPYVRLRARILLGRLEGRPPDHLFELDDEDVRWAATQQDAYRPQLVRLGLRRYLVEPSARVRRGLLDLWLRYRHRMGGALDGREALPFLEDVDVEVRERAARHVIERLTPDGTPGRRVDHLEGWGERLPALIERESEPRVALLLREIARRIAPRPAGE